jgi:hypothetical protein
MHLIVHEKDCAINIYIVQKHWHDLGFTHLLKIWILHPSNFHCTYSKMWTFTILSMVPETHNKFSYMVCSKNFGQ